MSRSGIRQGLGRQQSSPSRIRSAPSQKGHFSLSGTLEEGTPPVELSTSPPGTATFSRPAWLVPGEPAPGLATCLHHCSVGTCARAVVRRCTQHMNLWSIPVACHIAFCCEASAKLVCTCCIFQQTAYQHAPLLCFLFPPRLCW